jgi:hypothetical protein
LPLPKAKKGYNGLRHLAAQQKICQHKVILHIINIEDEDITNTNYQLIWQKSEIVSTNMPVAATRLGCLVKLIFQ